MDAAKNIFPKHFQKEIRFPELEKIVNETINHDAFELQTKHVLENIMRTTLGFSVCHFANTLSCVHHLVQDIYHQHPFAVETDTDMLHHVLKLATSSLTSLNNNPERSQTYTSDYVHIHSAAKEAGVDVCEIEQLIQKAHKNKSIPLELVTKELKFCKELSDYFIFSHHCTRSFHSTFATIALSTLTTPIVFKKISTSLEKYPDTKYSKFRHFIDCRTEIESDMNSILVRGALCKIADIDKVINTMISFFQFRKPIYDACLSDEKLF